MKFLESFYLKKRYAEVREGGRKARQIQITDVHHEIASLGAYRVL